MAKYIVTGFPHDHCKANGQQALTMRIGHECATICQEYDRTSFANTILHRYQIIIFYVARFVCQLTP
jgi:hypothetical protein